MITLGIILFIYFVFVLALMGYLMWKAPQGWEDESGLHFGERKNEKKK